MTNMRRGTTEKAGDLIQEVLEHNNLLKPYRHYELKKVVLFNGQSNRKVFLYKRYTRRSHYNRGIQFCMDESVIHV